jgi:hypothetical protein
VAPVKDSFTQAKFTELTSTVTDLYKLYYPLLVPNSFIRIKLDATIRKGGGEQIAHLGFIYASNFYRPISH